MSRSPRKVFYLDTNIVLDDPDCLEKFGSENEIRIPWPVISDIDGLKRRQDDVGRAAKEFSLNLLRSADGQHFQRGVTLRNGSTLRIVTEYTVDGNDPLPAGLSLHGGDLNILRSVEACRRGEPQLEHILITNDVNLSIAANYCGIAWEDRLADRVDIGEKFYKGYSFLDLEDTSCGDAARAVLALFFDSGQEKQKRRVELGSLRKELKARDFKAIQREIDELAHNKFWVFVSRSNRKDIDEGRVVDPDCIIRYDASRELFVPLVGNPGQEYFGCRALNLEQQLAFELGIHLSDRTFQYAIAGEAGTGKTFTWLLIALHNVYRARGRPDGKRNPEAMVYISKPRQPLGEEEYGFLPGELGEKIKDDYAGFARNFSKIIRAGKLMDQMLPDLFEVLKDDVRIIDIRPIGFIQGDTFTDDDWLLVDEAQNTNLKTIMTLATRGGHFVALGNHHRPDNPYVRPNSNGLVHAIEAVKRAKDLNKRYFLQAALQYRVKVRHQAVDYVLDCFPPRHRMRRPDEA